MPSIGSTLMFSFTSAKSLPSHDRVDCDGQDAGEGTDSERDDEKQRPNEIRHGARDLQHSPHDPVDGVMAREITCSEEAQQTADNRAEHGGEIGHQQGIEQAFEPLADVPVPLFDVAHNVAESIRGMSFRRNSSFRKPWRSVTTSNRAVMPAAITQATNSVLAKKA